jgi:hypothetical protein
MRRSRSLQKAKSTSTLRRLNPILFTHALERRMPQKPVGGLASELRIDQHNRLDPPRPSGALAGRNHRQLANPEGRKTRQHCALVFVRGSFLKLAKYTISPSLPRPWCRQVVLIQSDVRPEAGILLRLWTGLRRMESLMGCSMKYTVPPRACSLRSSSQARFRS